jgi:hypothetical protein
LNSKFEKNENSLPTACTCCWQRAIFTKEQSCTIRLLGKKALRQQHGSPVGEGLFPLPTANGLTAKLLAKQTASVPFGRARASPTAFLSQQECCWERTPSPTAELCHQSLDFGLLAKISFPTAEFSCWERFSSPTAQVLGVGKALGCWRSHSFL